MKLVFVYNADSGPISGLLDIGHKILSPGTYQCGLCKLTHDTFSEKEAWKNFRESSTVEMEFLHRDEFEEKYDLRFDYPVVLGKNANFDVLLSKKDIDSLEDLEALIEAVKKVLAVHA
jgi:hypothetical protein